MAACYVIVTEVEEARDAGLDLLGLVDHVDRIKHRRLGFDELEAVLVLHHLGIEHGPVVVVLEVFECHDLEAVDARAIVIEGLRNLVVFNRLLDFLGLEMHCGILFADKRIEVRNARISARIDEETDGAVRGFDAGVVERKAVGGSIINDIVHVGAAVFAGVRVRPG